MALFWGRGGGEEEGNGRCLEFLFESVADSICDCREVRI